MMLLATCCFGGSPATLAERLEKAVDASFAGLALLPGDRAPAAGDWRRACRRTGTGLRAAAWDALLPEDAEGADPAERPEALPTVLGRLRELDARLLILPAGRIRDREVRARGERLLGRLRSGDAVDAADEALQELLISTAHGRERQLEDLARLLYALRGAAPGLPVALWPSPSPAGLLHPASLKLLRSELSLPTLGLWHDPGVCALRATLGLDEPGAWLEVGGAQLMGVTLHDCVGGLDRLPPGSGQVDFRLIADYLPASALRVLALAPAYPEEVLGEARAALAAHGIR